MWNPFRRAREAEQRAQEIHLAALQALERVAVGQSDAYKALAQALTDYFDSFKTTETPRAWATNDFDEAKREQEALALRAGFPPGDDRSRLTWLQQELDG